MADIWMDVDTAITEAPVNIMPLIDDTDFKTQETGVTVGQLTLKWNFCLTDGNMTQTAVTATTSAGNYDWVNQGGGMYSIEIPASGGASINNDTEGFGWFSGVATGVLPWRGPIIGFRAAALNNSNIDGTTIDVNVTAMASGVVTATAIADAAIDLATFATDAKALMGVIAFGTAQAVTGTTIRLAAAESFANSEIVGATVLIRTSSAGAGQARVITAYSAATDECTVDAWTTNPDANCTYVVFSTAPFSTTAPLTANVTQWAGAAVATPTQAGVPEVDVTHNGGTAITAASGIQEVKVASIAANAITATAINADAITAAKIADGAIDAATFAAGAINAAAIATGAIDADALATDAVTEIADGLLNRDMSAVSDTTARSPLNALRFIRNKWSISGTTLTVTKEDDATSAWTSTVTASASADPITGNDPA